MRDNASENNISGVTERDVVCYGRVSSAHEARSVRVILPARFILPHGNDKGGEATAPAQRVGRRVRKSAISQVLPLARVHDRFNTKRKKRSGLPTSTATVIPLLFSIDCKR